LTKSSDLSRPGSHRRYLQGFVSGDSRARAFCRSRIPSRVCASAPISTRVAVRAKLSLPGNSVQNAQFAEAFQTHAMHGFDSALRPFRTDRQPKCQTAWAAWFFVFSNPTAIGTASAWKSSGTKGDGSEQITVTPPNCPKTKVGIRYRICAHRLAPSPKLACYRPSPAAKCRIDFTRNDLVPSLGRARCRSRAKNLQLVQSIFDRPGGYPVFPSLERWQSSPRLNWRSPGGPGPVNRSAR